MTELYFWGAVIVCILLIILQKDEFVRGAASALLAVLMFDSAVGWHSIYPYFHSAVPGDAYTPHQPQGGEQATPSISKGPVMQLPSQVQMQVV
jgi:hypothetical protein